ncbi:MAG: hypothetical protein AAGD13_04605 [Pseudomonadota bacterium]
MSIVPETYEEWENCITVKCGIPLTAKFVEDRIEALENTRDYGTRKFIDQWGEAHHARTLAWFREAEKRLSG